MREAVQGRSMVIRDCLQDVVQETEINPHQIWEHGKRKLLGKQSNYRRSCVIPIIAVLFDRFEYSKCSHGSSGSIDTPSTCFQFLPKIFSRVKNLEFAQSSINTVITLWPLPGSGGSRQASSIPTNKVAGQQYR